MPCEIKGKKGTRKVKEDGRGKREGEKAKRKVKTAVSLLNVALGTYPMFSSGQGLAGFPQENLRLRIKS